MSSTARAVNNKTANYVCGAPPDRWAQGRVYPDAVTTRYTPAVCIPSVSADKVARGAGRWWLSNAIYVNKIISICIVFLDRKKRGGGGWVDDDEFWSHFEKYI